MSSPPPNADQPSPDELERAWTGWLNQEMTQSLSYFSSLRMTMPPLSPEELEAVVATCDQIRQTLAGAIPTAKFLSDAGFGQFAQRLESAENENRAATKLYYEMLDSAVRARAQQQGIMLAAEREATLDLLASTQYSMDVFRRALQGIQDASMGYCYDCHIRPMFPGLNYCIDHARARGLII
jgi:hypothetical protein